MSASSAPTPKYSAAEASKTQETQAARPENIHKREPFTLDTCLNFLDATIFRAPVLLLVPVLLYLWEQRSAPGGLSSSTPLPSLSHLKELLFKRHKWIGRLFVFGLIKSANHHLNRYCANNGAYAADKPDWSNEVVVVTGGASGIGKAIVETLSHKRRAKVAVLDMAPPRYAPAPAGAPAIQYYKTDVTDAAQVKAVAEQIRATLGEPTILVNNAGIASGSTILECNLASVERLWRVNHLSNFVTLQEFLPHMVRRNHGHVVTVASSASFFSLPSMSEYTTSKTATLALHEVLKGELRERYHAPKVRATIVAPTKVRTALGDGMEDHSLPFLHPVLDPYQLGRRVLEAVDSGLSQYLVLPRLMEPLPALRGFPDWMRRAFEVIGHTDQIVSSKSISRAFKNGYGADWEGEAAKHRLAAGNAAVDSLASRASGNKK
ncbi:unnamed protein product [Parajaminaea phylloscopi]